MQRLLDIDPDITQASTPPGWFYTDGATFDQQRERVFARSWQYAGEANAIRVPGQVHPFTLLEGCLDEPLLLTRDQDDRTHCVSNVCTHRGALVVEGPGNERTLRCRYHGRRFSLEGKFHSMPEFEEAKCFPREEDHLRPTALEQYGPMLFTSLNPAVSFADLLKPMRDRMGWLTLDQFVHDPNRSRDYLVGCNWALYCDNYLEGFHIPYVHASLAEKIDYGGYRTELYDWCNVQVGQGSEGELCFDLPRSSPDFGQRIAAYYWWVFPNMMFNFYPWGLSLNIVRPLAVDRTRVSFMSFVGDPSKVDQGAGVGLDRVEREDEAVVESVQKGLRGRLYGRGRYSPTRETGVHHFHRLLATMLVNDHS